MRILNNIKQLSSVGILYAGLSNLSIADHPISLPSLVGDAG